MHLGMRWFYRVAGAHSSSRRRVRREVADIEHRPQQLGLGQNGLSFCNHVRGRMLAPRLLCGDREDHPGCDRRAVFKI